MVFASSFFLKKRYRVQSSSSRQREYTYTHTTVKRYCTYSIQQSIYTRTRLCCAYTQYAVLLLLYVRIDRRRLRCFISRYIHTMIAYTIYLLYVQYKYREKRAEKKQFVSSCWSTASHQLITDCMLLCLLSPDLIILKTLDSISFYNEKFHFFTINFSRRFWCF